MTARLKPTTLGGKSWKKLVPLDRQTGKSLEHAAEYLGIPATAFIRLALHRAFEQLLEILTQFVDQAAQEYVESRAHGFYRIKSKAGVPRHALDDDAELQKLISRVLPMNVSRREAYDGVARALQKHTARNWGKLNFKGSRYEQYLAQSILDTGNRNAKEELRAAMADVFVQRARIHAGKWRALRALQKQVTASIMGTTELLDSYRQDLASLRAGLPCLEQKEPVPASFMQTLAQSALVLHSRWGHMSDNDRIEEVRQKIAQFSTALEKLTAQRKRNRQQLERLKATREFWLNPWALESWLESQKKVDAFLP
jgi:hypothetical protein